MRRDDSALKGAANMAQRVWRVGPKRELALDRPRIIGILNVTPDSFSDGGAYAGPAEAIAAALRMKDEGACIIDIGGESTRPGAIAMPVEEQLRRTIPVIEGIRAQVSSDELLLSIDTTQAAVARASLDAGANIINDQSAGRDDPDMLPLAASRGCGLILMHRLNAPRQDSYSDRYIQPPDYSGDVLGAVRSFLHQRCDAALSAGVDPHAIVIDPGLGFGKTVEQNYELIARVDALSETYPALCAVSRKSFIGAVSGVQTPAARVFGSVAAAVAMWFAGVRLFRVHDVAAHREALAVAEAIGSSSRERTNA